MFFIGETGDLRPLIFLGYLGLRQTWGAMPLRVAVSWDAEVNKVLFSLVMILCTETCHHWNHLTSRTLRNGTYRPHSVCGVILNPTHGMILIPHSHMSFALKIADVQVATMPTHQRSVSKYSIEFQRNQTISWCPLTRVFFRSVDSTINQYSTCCLWRNTGRSIIKIYQNILFEQDLEGGSP